MIGRKDFIRFGGASLSAALFGACDSQGPDDAAKLLAYAEKKNEGVERWLLRHTSMDHTKSNVAPAGDKFPSYFISDVVPTLDAAGLAAWRLEIGGMVGKPLSLTLDDLMKLERKTQRVNHYCVEGWTAVAEFTGVPLSSLAKLAQADPKAGYVDFQSFDNGYHESWDAERRDASADDDRVREGRQAAAAGVRRAGAGAFAGEAWVQEHEVSDEDRVHAGAERWVLVR